MIRISKFLEKFNKITRSKDISVCEYFEKRSFSELFPEVCGDILRLVANCNLTLLVTENWLTEFFE